MKNPIQVNRKRSTLNTMFVVSGALYIAAIIIWQMQSFDVKAVMFFNFIVDSPFWLGFNTIVSDYGMTLIMVVYALFLVFSLKIEELKRDRVLFFLILVSFAMSTLGGDLLKEILDKPRPLTMMTNSITNLQMHDTPAFPSGHSAKSMALALPFALLAVSKHKITFLVRGFVLVIGFLVCFSRIALQAHFLSDIVAGIGTALFFIPIAISFTNYFYRKIKLDEAILNMMAVRFIFVFTAFSVVLVFL